MSSNSIKLRQGQFATVGRTQIDRYPQLVLGIKLFLLLCLGYFLYRLASDPVNIQICAGIIIVAALVPAYLWASGRRSGLPILPLHTFMLIWAFALPLVAGHPLIKAYNQDEILFSAISVALYALSATAAWYLVTRRGYKVRRTYYVIPVKHGYKFFIIALFMGAFFIQLALAGEIVLEPGVFAIVRSIIFSFMLIAIFVLAYQMGQRELNRFQTIVFIFAVMFTLIMQLATLYLIGAMVSTAIALVGYTLGRQRVPWKSVLVVIMVFGLLQSGKQDIRERYSFWSIKSISFNEMPALFTDWFGAGVDAIFNKKGEQETENLIYERVSLVHLLLYIERTSPRDIPYLEGATYEIIPSVLTPRFINPEKLSPHSAGKILNLHYGFQTTQGTYHTSIAWGILNEAYANFGLMGIIGIACFIGLLFGWIGRWTAGAPVLSLENLVGVTLISAAIQTEQTMAVMISVLFQSLIVLILVIPLLVKQNIRTG